LSKETYRRKEQWTEKAELKCVVAVLKEMVNKLADRKQGKG